MWDQVVLITEMLTLRKKNLFCGTNYGKSTFARITVAVRFIKETGTREIAPWKTTTRKNAPWEIFPEILPPENCLLELFPKFNLSRHYLKGIS